MRTMAKSMRLALLIGALVALCAAAAHGALIKVGPLILRADGGFSPTALPKKKFVPIQFHGHVDISTQAGGAPPALEQAELDFDRDGRLTTRGLAECQVSQVSSATPAQARRLCAASIVGEGHVAGVINLPLLSVSASSLLTVFNGPRVAGNPSVILHAQLRTPSVQTFAILVPIERTSGPYGYRVRIDLPAIAGGLGSITHVDARIGRRYVYGGVKRSYTSARCSDGILETHGHFIFADGTVMDGTVSKFCRML